MSNVPVFENEPGPVNVKLTLLMWVVRPSLSSMVAVPVDSPTASEPDGAGVERLEQPRAAVAAMAKPIAAALHIAEKFILLTSRGLRVASRPESPAGTTAPGRPSSRLTPSGEDCRECRKWRGFLAHDRLARPRRRPLQPSGSRNSYSIFGSGPLAG